MTNDTDNAAKVARAAANLHKLLERSGGKYLTSQSHALLDLCNAMIGLIDDGDCLGQREALMDELRCDEDGNPVNEDGFVIARSSFGLHHPDSPSFGGAR